MCQEAPCTIACKTGDPARAIRAIRFDNHKLATRWVAACSDADLEAAEKACIRFDGPIPLKALLRSISPDDVTADYPSLEIDFCGIHCENPFFLASSAVCTNYEMVARAFEAGWAGVFYKTICLQEIKEVSPRFDAVHSGGLYGDFYGFRNMEQLSENPVDMDFDILRRLKEDYPSKVVIASIMGQTEEQWIELAHRAEQAGCDAVELNFSCPQMKVTGMGSDVGQNAELVVTYTFAVKKAVKIPVIPKMTPNITHIYHPALAAFFAGADAISAINTIKSVTMADQLGCSNVQVCTAVMQYGYRIIDDLVLGLQRYMAKHGVRQLSDLVGSELSSFTTPSDLDRTTIVYPKINRERCVGCGRCELSCRDGAHQAITFDKATRQPHIVGTKCVGCHLCRIVCPAGAIGLSKRIDKK